MRIYFHPPPGEQVQLGRLDAGFQPANVTFSLNQGTLATPGCIKLGSLPSFRNI